jgi:selenocysteine lyase/cysteine desulfurase
MPNTFPTTLQLLVMGGDERIALDTLRGVNRYGCGSTSDPELHDFASSTASVISAAAFQAADHLRTRLAKNIPHLTPAALYHRELSRMREELLSLCALGDLPDPDIVFAASGTDLHRIAAQLARAETARPVLAIMVNESETGSGVFAAINDSHPGIEVLTVPLRETDGTPRHAKDIDAEFIVAAQQAYAAGYHVLLIQTDISKTGMIAPSYGCTAALHRTLGTHLDVLIDACQFRIAPATLRACLARGYSVALTGSKFVGGPSFSGVLLIPAETAARLRTLPFPSELATFSAVADWPNNWPVQGILEASSNFGLLLRWEAALYELRAFRAIPDADIACFLRAFAGSIQARLTDDPTLSPVAVPELDRSALLSEPCWDQIQTIFPFQLYRTDLSARHALDTEETQRIYRNLPTIKPRCQLGQPVNYGAGKNALRLCLSARLIVRAAEHDGACIIEQAQSALDQAIRLADSGSFKTFCTDTESNFTPEMISPGKNHGVANGGHNRF